MVQNTFYGSIVFLSCFALVILCILVSENGRFSKDTKLRFYLTYTVLILSMIAEWGSIALNNGPEQTIRLHAVVKSLDYILTPIAACMLVRLVPSDVYKHRLLFGLMGVNILLQIISIFTGWMFYIDSSNVYQHGPLYPLYFVIYTIAIIDVVCYLLSYSRNFNKMNHTSLILIICLVCFGIGAQELWGGNIRSCSLALAFGSILQFIHFGELWQQRVDENLIQKQHQLETDPLTGLYNRYAYNETLREYADKEIEEDFVIISIDVNGLKRANDNLGHEAGDELLRGAAGCIDKALSSSGKCFRTGGDEFVCLIHADRQHTERLKADLRERTGRWHGRLVESVSLSIGSASHADYPGLSVEKLITLADQEMYTDKDAYYQRTGLPRR